MEARKVELDFSDANTNWSKKQPEFAQFMNATSTCLPYFEPFLVKAARQARDRLPESATDLRHDTEVFVYQEARHSKLHTRFNKVIYDAGYERIRVREAQIKADYERFAKKGVKFCLAYGEGFETLGPLVSYYMFEHREELGIADWEEEPAAFLFVWHLAEEYEHRSVINYLYKELYGGYWYRLYGMGFGLYHLGKYGLGGALEMIDADCEAGKSTGRLRRKLRFALVMARVLRYVTPRLIVACGPNYDPGQMPAPPGCEEFLEEVSKEYGVVA